jgi:[FeFe] hydrogenase H-cluster maturation GTPase HydF
MRNTPKGSRLHIGIFGRRNVGKSSLLNALTRQQVSIVSEVAGTTTDPVEKPMELLPIGPVLFIDTAGIDDVGALGQLRVERTRQVFDRTDVGVLVTEAGQWGPFEEQVLAEFRSRQIPTVVVFNKMDLLASARDLGEPGRTENASEQTRIETTLVDRLKTEKTPLVKTVASRGEGVLDLREALIRVAPEEFINAPHLLGDLVPAGELAVLVVPIDLEAPMGRLILPQVQAIRDVLDVDAYCLVVKERELRDALDRLKRPPCLVVTDSQGFLKVAGDTPPGVPLTSFSILFARYKGDLSEFVRGALAIDSLRTGDRVLVAEACTHHPIGDDIGRVKIPRWLQQYVGGKIELTAVQGHDFPEDVSPFKLVVHCGACMWNRREMLSRILRCRKAGVPITNYGLAIAYSLGIFERALGPFPAALDVYRAMRKAGR